MSDVHTGKGWEMRSGKWQESPPEEVDHIIADPPFDEATDKGERRQGGEFCVEFEKSFDPLDVDDVAAELVDRVRRWAICFCAVEQFGAYKAAVGADRYFRSGAWVKSNPTPQFTGDRPGMWGEGIAIMHSRDRGANGNLVERPRWSGGGKAAIWRHSAETSSSCCRDQRVHETQKPLDLMIALVEDFTDPGDLVWDPYAGSATTGVACILTGRRFIGHEMQERYVEIADRVPVSDVVEVEGPTAIDEVDAVIDRWFGESA